MLDLPQVLACLLPASINSRIIVRPEDLRGLAPTPSVSVSPISVWVVGVRQEHEFALGMGIGSLGGMSRGMPLPRPNVRIT